MAIVVVAVAACASGPAASPVTTATPQPAPSLGDRDQRDASDLALSGLDAPTATRYVEIAMNDPWVVETLGRDRAEPVEVVDYGDGKSGIAVFLYDYSTSKALRVGFAPGVTTIAERTVSVDQPSFSPREVTRARELAAASERVKAAGLGYTVQSVTGADAAAFEGHRVLALILTAAGPSDRSLVAYADLSADAIVLVDDPSAFGRLRYTPPNANVDPADRPDAGDVICSNPNQEPCGP